MRTMCALARDRDEVRVVNDQFGCPTYAPDIAAAIICLSRNLLENPSDSRLRGLFHLAGSGETSWAGLAEAIFSFLEAKALRRPVLTPIASADYPTRARRPAIRGSIAPSSPEFTALNCLPGAIRWQSVWNA